MSDEDALLAAIAAHPDEDTPRLAYADWLQEHDQHIRAEFIRLQIDIAHKETLPRVLQNRYVDLWKRQQELLDNHRAELLGRLTCLREAEGYEFRRGFVSEMRTSVPELCANWDTIGFALPVPRVALIDWRGLVRDVLGCGEPAPLPVGSYELVSALVSRGPGLEDETRLEPLTDPHDWPRLEQLDASGCRLGDADVGVLLRAKSFTVLADLDFSRNDLTDVGVSALLDSGLTRQLQRLILSGNPISDDAAIALAERWPTGDADKLKSLDLRFTNIGQRGQQALLRRFGGRVDLF